MYTLYSSECCQLCCKSTVNLWECWRLVVAGRECCPSSLDNTLPMQARASQPTPVRACGGLQATLHQLVSHQAADTCRQVCGACLISLPDAAQLKQRGTLTVNIATSQPALNICHACATSASTDAAACGVCALQGTVCMVHSCPCNHRYNAGMPEA